MPTSVSDFRSSKDEQVAHAAEVLRSAPNRIAVFEAIYRGKTKVKTRSEIEKATGLNNKQVLNAGKVLVNNELVTQVKFEGETAYQKDAAYSTHKKKILQLAHDPDKLKAQPRTSQPRGDAPTKIQVTLSTSSPPPELITVDDIHSFARVRDVKAPSETRVDIPESVVKDGIRAILGEAGEFKDWGGENSDLTTSRLTIGRNRVSTAFAFKGRAVKGKLTPRKMGRNGDQIQRLFTVEAGLYVVQYVGQIGDNVVTQVSAMAVARAAGTRKKIRYCLIDGQDTARLMEAYPEAFQG